MKWTRKNKYHLGSDPPGFTICRINMGTTRQYELWDVLNKRCLARRVVKTDAEAEIAVAELKELAK